VPSAARHSLCHALTYACYEDTAFPGSPFVDFGSTNGDKKTFSAPRKNAWLCQVRFIIALENSFLSVRRLGRRLGALLQGRLQPGEIPSPHGRGRHECGLIGRLGLAPSRVEARAPRLHRLAPTNLHPPLQAGELILVLLLARDHDPSPCLLRLAVRRTERSELHRIPTFNSPYTICHSREGGNPDLDSASIALDAIKCGMTDK
jgi:hypothetical protein